MRVEIVKGIAGTGDYVEGFRHEFSLEPGMIAEVDAVIAVGWLASGIAVPAPVPTSEVETLATPERAVRKAGRPRKRGSA